LQHVTENHENEEDYREQRNRERVNEHDVRRDDYSDSEDGLHVAESDVKPVAQVRENDYSHYEAELVQRGENAVYRVDLQEDLQREGRQRNHSITQITH
jgi:hypothetical protein